MRREGHVRDGYYVIADGETVVQKIPLEEARGDRKLAKAIERNGWEKIDA